MMKFAVIDESKCDIRKCEEIPDNCDAPCYDGCKRHSIDIACPDKIRAVVYTKKEDADFYEVLPCNGCSECVPLCPLEAISMEAGDA